MNLSCSTVLRVGGNPNQMPRLHMTGSESNLFVDYIYVLDRKWTTNLSSGCGSEIKNTIAGTIFVFSKHVSSCEHCLFLQFLTALFLKDNKVFLGGG